MTPGEFNRGAIEAILSGVFSRSDANALGLLCRALAIASVRRRQAAARIGWGSPVLDEEDIIQESFVQLFRRDGAGRFTEIERYFRRMLPGHGSASDAAILQTLRRLVTVKVSNGIVTVYSRTDPALGRVLRNLRLALKRSTLFEIFQRFGEDYLRPVGIPALPQLEPIPLTAVRNGLGEAALAADRTPEMLRKLHIVLAGESRFQPILPLVQLALILRATYGGEPDGAESVPPPETDDTPEVVQALCRRLHLHWHPKYVGTGKMGNEEFHSICGALKRSLLAQGSDGQSYFEHLKAEMPGLTKERYRERYRTILEYMVKTARRELYEELGR